jgi:hypothetical protein
VTALWAGDSRAYVFRPSVGLQQLSVDHARENDVFEQLDNDSPMTNIVSESVEFTIGRFDLHLPGDEPFVALCASDGVFGYVRTPGQLEHHLLDTLAGATDPAQWARALSDRVRSYTADDATIALGAFGFRDFGALRKAFTSGPRPAKIRRTQHDPFAAAPGAPVDAADLRVRRLEAWQQYAPTYTALMRDGT